MHDLHFLSSFVIYCPRVLTRTAQSPSAGETNIQGQADLWRCLGYQVGFL